MWASPHLHVWQHFPPLRSLWLPLHSLQSLLLLKYAQLMLSLKSSSLGWFNVSIHHFIQVSIYTSSDRTLLTNSFKNHPQPHHSIPFLALCVHFYYILVYFLFICKFHGGRDLRAALFTALCLVLWQCLALGKHSLAICGKRNFMILNYFKNYISWSRQAHLFS